MKYNSAKFQPLTAKECPGIGLVKVNKIRGAAQVPPTRLSVNLQTELATNWQCCEFNGKFTVTLQSEQMCSKFAE